MSEDLTALPVLQPNKNKRIKRPQLSNTWGYLGWRHPGLWVLSTDVTLFVIPSCILHVRKHSPTQTHLPKFIGPIKPNEQRRPLRQCPSLLCSMAGTTTCL